MKPHSTWRKYEVSSERLTDQIWSMADPTNPKERKLQCYLEELPMIEILSH
jgi:hypothetical protein